MNERCCIRVSDDDLRRVVALAASEDHRSDEEQAALERVAVHVDERLRTTGVHSYLHRLARCTRMEEAS